MIFVETKIEGALIIEPERDEDKRGFFIRAWCEREFEQRGLISHFVQFNISCSKKAGTLRGLHYQVPPHQEAKLMCCTKGVLYDVILDTRPKSPTFKRWLAVDLRADTYKMLYIPCGVAHGFQTLTDDTEVFYPVSQFYFPESERGIRWNDPTFAIKWPETGTLILSDKDKNWPDWSL